MSHFESIRPGGVMPPGMVMGASDYIRWDITQSKAISGDLGTSPGSNGISWSGVPVLSVQSIVVTVTTSGMVGGPCKFAWSLNGVVQATGVTAFASVSLGTTGISVLFPNGSYNAGDTSTYAPWNPTSPIVIGGAGLSLPQNSNLRGGVRTGNGGRIVMGSATNKVPTLSPTRTRSIFMSTAQLESGGNGFGALGTLLTTGGLSIAIPSRYLHHDGGSRITSVVLSYFCNATLTGAIATGFAFVGFDNAGANVGPVYEVGTAVLGWGPSTWSAGQYLRPFGVSWGLNPYLGYYFRCTVGGASAGAEPTWNITPGATTSDGAATWLCIGGTGVTGGFAGSVGQARYDFDPIQAATLNLGTTRYSIQFGANAGLAAIPGGVITLFGVTFNFNTITDMTPY